MILVDKQGHMVSDRRSSELHAFAWGLGLQLRWYQKTRLPHYDLTTPRKLQQALARGAKLVSTREIVRALKANEN